MKRSEAIKKVAARLYGYRRPPDLEEEISWVLSEFENVGLLPPYKTKERIGDQFQHTWEKEKDEEK